MDYSIELLLKQRIFPELEKGRPDWDGPHTEAVVYYIKEIIKHLGYKVDDDVLIISAYAHDWGYADLFKRGQYVGTEDIKRVKEVHAQISARKITALLQENPNFLFLSSEQKRNINRLVLIHDSLELLQAREELVFMEADTLGQLDVDKTPPTFNAEDNLRYLNRVKKNRISRFITHFSKEKAEELLIKREKYYTDKFS